MVTQENWPKLGGSYYRLDFTRGKGDLMCQGGGGKKERGKYWAEKERRELGHEREERRGDGWGLHLGGESGLQVFLFLKCFYN